MNDVAISYDEITGTVWAEIGLTSDQKPVLQRYINLYEFGEANDTVDTVKERLHLQCRELLDRHLNLSLYCERALTWVRETAKGTQVQLSQINSFVVSWKYCWEGKEQLSSFRFNDTIMCIDWVCGSGLTEAASDFIISAVTHDIEVRESRQDPVLLKKRQIIREFVATLPLRKSLFRAPASLLDAIAHLRHPLAIIQIP